MDHSKINPTGALSQLYPWHIRTRLVAASIARDCREIDALTDTLAHMGLVRPRTDQSMFAPLPRLADDRREQR